METAGLVERRRPDSSIAGTQQLQTFALTEQGWARAANLEAE